MHINIRDGRVFCKPLAGLFEVKLTAALPYYSTVVIRNVAIGICFQRTGKPLICSIPKKFTMT